MSHKDALKQLFPLDLGGVFQDDINLEGNHLDNARDKAGDLLDVMFLGGDVLSFVSDWERVLAIIPGTTDGTVTRKNRVLAELRKVGGLSKTYFTALAAAMGYDITITDNIEEYRPFMTGWAHAADSLYAYEVMWMWKVQVLSYFEAGDAEAGDYLLTWDSETKLEDLFNDLKPAHTYVWFE